MKRLSFFTKVMMQLHYQSCVPSLQPKKRQHQIHNKRKRKKTLSPDTIAIWRCRSTFNFKSTIR